MPRTSRRNTATASWRCICHEPSATSRARSLFHKHRTWWSEKWHNRRHSKRKKRKSSSRKTRSYFVPTTDIFETEDALTVVMEVPGVEKGAVEIAVENDVLRIEAKIDPAKYEGMDPLYTEYNVGHFARSFTLSNKIDQQQISAQLEDGVLTLTLKKAKEATPRRIAIS